MTLRLLVVASETPEQRDTRRKQAGASSDETYVETLRSLDSDIVVETMSCVDDTLNGGSGDIDTFDGIFFAGSPIEMHEDTPETQAAARFMTTVFETGVPAFGSCAGLQIAAVAAGGTSEPRRPSMKAGFVRGIVATDAGRDHFLLADRPIVWDAPAMHAHVVGRMPRGGTVLASSRHTPVEAAEIRVGEGVFYGVQYHPEITLAEVAAALRREAQGLIDQGLARKDDDVETYAIMLDQLAADPNRRDLVWRLGIHDDVIETRLRLTEIRNCLTFLRERAV